MIDVGTPCGEPRRAALAEVIKSAMEKIRTGEAFEQYDYAEELPDELLIADAVLQHLASQRQEQAKEIVNKWYGEQSAEWMHKRALLPMGDFNPLVEAIAAALAASAAKVTEGGRNMDHARGYDAGYEAGGHDMIRTMWDGPCIKQTAFGAEPCLESDPDPCIVCRLGADRDTLAAKLEASERDRDSDRQSLMEVLKRLQESETARGASERALERVKWTLAEIRGLVPAIAPAGDQGMAHLRQIAHLIERALASPEARAKTTMGVTGSVIVPKTQPSHVCSVDYLPDGSIGCPRCSGFEDGPEARATGEGTA